MARKSSMPATTAQSALARLIGRMEVEASSDDEDFMSPMITGVTRIITAETPEEMWESDELDQVGGRDLEDVEQVLLGYVVKYSASTTIASPFRDSAGRGMYLLIRSARLDTGEEFSWNTSAPLVVSKILWLADHDMLEGAKVVIRGREGGAGRVLRLTPIPERAVEPPF
jgi:hypothetical protein